jgi:hypothetical protein
MATITALPTPPTRSDPVNFATRADDFLAALPVFGSEANDVASEINTNKTIAVNSATSATTSATSATASAASATASATSATASATSATASATSAASSFASFNIRYLGSKTTNPTVDNLGNALTLGATYWNSTANSLRYWDGTTWATPVETAVTSSTNAQTAFTNFSAKYLGAKTANPTVDNFGQPLVAGASYWNTVTNDLRYFEGPGGSSWFSPAASANSSRQIAENAALSAQTSATSATDSATSAQTSATSAQTSATNASASATSASTSATNANTTYVDFSAKYLGSKTSAPSVDNTGAALTEGAIYWNSTVDQLYIWTGSAWDQVAFSVSGTVTSFNTRTGSVTLNSSDVTNALNSTVDVTVGNLTGTQISATSAVRVNNATVIDSSQNWLGSTIPVNRGGTGATSLTGVLVGNGTGAVTTKTVPAGEIVGTTDSQTISNKVLVNVREVQQAMAANNADLAVATYFTKTITATTTFTVSNVPANGQVVAFILDLTNAGSQSITWFANTRWAGGVPPTLTASGRDILGFFTFNGGANWVGVLVSRDVR